jgi:hypothetical protein
VGEEGVWKTARRGATREQETRAKERISRPAGRSEERRR